MTVAPPSPPYRGPAPHTGAANNKPIKRIVIHCTAGAEPGVAGAARGTIDYTKRSGVFSSYHYVADSRESLQFVYDSVVAYHCGTNSNSIGYELSCSLSDEGRGHWQRDDHQAMLKIAAADVARLCLAYDVPMVKLSVAELKAGRKGLCGHVDMRGAFGNTTHWDPGPHFPWDDFVRMVRAEADTLTDPPKLPAPEPPKPEPKPEVPPHHPFTVALLPGRWDAPLKAWLERHREARDKAADIIVLTEGTREPLVREFTSAVRRFFWETYHDPTPGPSNIIHTWDSARFEQVGLPWKVRLEDDLTFTKKGHPHPDTYAVGVALRDKAADEVLLILGAHLPLENTARRRAAKAEALATLKARGFREGREQFPDAARIVAADWNRPARKASVREWFTATFPKLTPAWVANGRNSIDWQAGSKDLALLESRVLPRAKADPLDHHTKVTRWGWR